MNLCDYKSVPLAVPRIVPFHWIAIRAAECAPSCQARTLTPSTAACVYDERLLANAAALAIGESEFAKMSVPKSISLVNCKSIRLIVRAKPGAKKSNVVSIDDEAIGVQIAAPAREGEANKELVEFISGILRIKKSCVNLDFGTKSRNKTLIVNAADKTVEDVFALLQESINK